MLKISIATWIANAAACLTGTYGDVTHQAESADCSRQTVYDHAQKVQAAVGAEHAGGPTRAELIQENSDLRQENARLWEWLAQTVEFPPDKQHEFTVTATAMGLSLNQILVLLALILGAQARPGRTTLHRWIKAAGIAAGRVLKHLDGDVRRWCWSAASMRSSSTVARCWWAWSRRAWSGSWARRPTIARGRPGRGRCRTFRRSRTSWRMRERACKPGSPRCNSNGNRTGNRRWRTASMCSTPPRRRGASCARSGATWNGSGSRPKRPIAGSRRRSNRATMRGAAVAARCVWKKTATAFQQYERSEAGWKIAHAALQVFRPEGRLNERPRAQEQIARALPQLSGREWSKVRNYLQAEETLTFLDRLHRQLQEVAPEEPLRGELVRLWWLRRQRPRATPAGRIAGAGHVAHLVQRVVCHRMGANWHGSYREVARVLRQAVRASSAVECMNSVLRMHQSRHRTVTQGLLDLKRLYWNCRAFREGKRRGRCPYEHLGLKLPGYRFWDLLGMPTPTGATT